LPAGNYPTIYSEQEIVDPSIFKAYDIRGVYPDQLDEEAAWKIGYGTAGDLESER